MNVEKLELHDALVKEMNINFVDRVAIIIIEFYVDSSDRTRKAALFRFADVQSISTICNLQRLEDNARAGNVNYWVPGKPDDNTYIYLVDGCLAIQARLISVDLQQQRGAPSNISSEQSVTTIGSNNPIDDQN